MHVPVDFSPLELCCLTRFASFCRMLTNGVFCIKAWPIFMEVKVKEMNWSHQPHR